jgi:hypothetical protein
MPGFGKVRRYKLIQLQPVAGSEDQVIEITNPLKEILNIALIRKIESVPFRLSVERCGLLNPRSALLDAMIARAPRATTCCATAKPMPDDPPSTTIRLSESSRDSQFVAFVSPRSPFLWPTTLCHTPIDGFHSAYGSCTIVMAAMRPEKL